MCVSIAIINIFKKMQLSKMEEYEGKDLEMKDQGLPMFLSFLCSAGISIINDNLIKTIRRFTDYEKHQTITKINVSVAVKLTFARFLNCSVILLTTNDNVKGWFGGASLAYDASILIAIMAATQPTIYALNIGGRMKKNKIEKLKAKQEAGEDVVMT